MLRTFFFALTIPARFVRAAMALVTSPRLLRWCVPPWIIGFITAWLAFGFVSARIDTLFTQSSLFTGGILEQLVSFLGAGAAVLIAAFLGVVSAGVAGAFFFDLLVEDALERYGAHLPTSHTLGGRLTRTVRAVGSDLAILILVLGLTALGLLLSFIPPVALLSGVLGVLLLGFELTDKPLSILEVPFRERVLLVRRHPFECLSLGGIQALVLLIPGANIILLPVLYLLATEVVTGWRREISAT